MSLHVLLIPIVDDNFILLFVNVPKAFSFFRDATQIESVSFNFDVSLFRRRRRLVRRAAELVVVVVVDVLLLVSSGVRLEIPANAVQT